MHRFAFLGTTGQYYRIYVVNTLLTILTFGIYSAWAKVRNRRFFYGFTELLDNRFDFDARPIVILISRVLVVVVVLVAAYMDEVFDWLWQDLGLMSTALLLLVPFALVRGRAFNARHSLFMGIRFHYERIYGPAYRVFILFVLPLVALFVLLGSASLPETDTSDAFLDLLLTLREPLSIIIAIYLIVLLPCWYRMRDQIKINQLSFGKLQLRYTATLRQYYGAYMRALLLLLLALLIGTVPFLYFASTQTISSTSAQIIFWTAVGGSVLASLWFLYYRALLVALYWNAIDFTDGKLRANFSGSDYLIKITLPNMLLTILSLGILLPWTRVRRWRYIARALVLHVSAEQAAVLYRADAFKEAFSSEYIDIEGGFDFDAGLI